MYLSLVTLVSLRNFHRAELKRLLGDNILSAIAPQLCCGTAMLYLLF